MATLLPPPLMVLLWAVVVALMCDQSASLLGVDVSGPVSATQWQVSH